MGATMTVATACASASADTLVVYYSATGTTARVARDIAAETSGTLFVVKPSPDYSAADLVWSDPNSRVSKENADTSLRNVPLKTATVPNFEKYDTVFIGYPIWWGIAAWPVSSFVKQNDFTGKRVIPFATSYSSPLADSGVLLSKEAGGNGNWEVGKRFQSSVGSKEVTEWAREVMKK